MFSLKIKSNILKKLDRSYLLEKVFTNFYECFKINYSEQTIEKPN